MSIISEIAQGLSSVLKRTQKPVMQYAENIALVAEVPFDKEKVNQCQGFTYNPQTEKFIVACINADSTTQILYELNKDFTVVRSIENTGADKLGHCNTLFFDGKLRATNGAANGNRIYTVGDDLTPGEYKDYTDRFYNVGYNNVTGQYVSILPGEDNSTRKIKIYANSDLTDGKEYTVTVNEKNNDSNGALFIGNKVIFSLMRRIVEVEIGDNTATIVRELEFEPKAEIEDFALVDGAIYMAANSHDYIRIYKYDFARSYYNNINNDFLNNGIVVGNQVGYHGQSVDKATNYVMAKINANNNLEVGDKRNLTTILGKELKHYNGTNSYTVLTTYHYDKAIYNKVKTDELFVKKADVQSLVGNKKSLNVVAEGVDNTGATDVTEKLNEIFTKANAEKYEEVIFPDGTYKIENVVKIFCPEKMSRSLVVKSENTYGATILCDHTDASQGDIGFVLTRNVPENEDGTVVNAYNTTIDGFIFKVKDQDADGSNFKFIGSESTISSLLFTNVKLVNLRMTNTKDCAGQNIDLVAQCNNLTIDNVKTNYGMYAVYLEYSYGINNTISNIVSNNCTYCLSTYSYADFESVTLHFDDTVDLNSGTMANFYANKISNFKLTGRWALNQNPLYINVGPRAEISNVTLDITLDENADHVLVEEKPSAFIYLISPESAKIEVKVSDLKFDKFQENFDYWIQKGTKFSWINSPELSISPNGISEYPALTLFNNLGSVDEYSSRGFLNRKYEIKAEDSAKTRIYLGYDRTIHEAKIDSKDELADGEGSAIFFGVNGVPYKDAKDYDYSNYTAGVAGDVYLESKPNNSGHFGYVSTYRYTTRTEYLPTADKPTSVTNHGDRTITFGFDKFPVWTNGTLKDTPIIVGSGMNVLGKGLFKVIETDVEAKTMKCEIPETYKSDVITSLADLTMEIYFTPGKPINTMGTMTYETIPIIHSGPTEKRPTEHLVVGQQYFDTTLDMPVFWNGTKWVVNAADVGDRLKDYVRIDKLMATDMTQAPAFAGQMIIDNNTLYIAESTEGPGSWRIVYLQPNDHL